MKKGILVISFGTTYNETRKLCIESIEDRIRKDFKDAMVLRAFTSKMVISRLEKRDGHRVDTPREALERLKENGIKDISIQPLHIIEGHEYEKILREVDDFLIENDGFSIRVGRPLLSRDTDYIRVVEGLNLPKVGETTVFMGHGSDHSADISYEKLEETFRKLGYGNVFIGTVEGSRGLEQIIGELKNIGTKKVLLKPFMLVAGDHALNDMASDKEDSWKTILERNGFNVEVEIKGLGQIKAIQDIFINYIS